MGINKVILVGNVGREPEFKALPSGTSLVKFSLATNEPRSKNKEGEEHTEWHNIVAWRGLAEFCRDYVKKGQQMYIEGRIRTRSYEQDGQRKYFTEIHAYIIELLGSRRDADGGPGGAMPSDDGGYPSDGDDVPF